MKILKTTITLFALFISLTLQAQFTPYSTQTKTRQQLGFGYVTIEYTRPIARGRKIFGGLIPYDEMWHTGASGTTITFDRTVQVAGFRVPPGSYAVQVFPRKTEWTFVLSTAEDGIGKYNAKYDVVNVCVPVTKPNRFFESYTVELDMTPTGADLYVSWTDVQIKVPIRTLAQQRELAYIDSMMTLPALDDPHQYYLMANYLLFHNREPEKVLELLQRSSDFEKRVYVQEGLARAYHQLGRQAEVTAALDNAAVVAREEFADDPEGLGYVLERLGQHRRMLVDDESGKREE